MPGLLFDPDRDFGQWKPEQQDWWKKWRKRSRRATLRLVQQAAEGVAPDVDARQSVWADLKLWLAENFFHGKCSYCDRKVDAKFETDCEHYRPKGAVTRIAANGEPEAVLDQNGVPHPGYYWLAVNWRNLLPSCKRCNNQKLSLFPIFGAYLYAPPDLPSLASPAKPKEWAEALWEHLDSPAFWDRHQIEEQPLLLYPNDQDASQNLVFEETGVISAGPGNLRFKTSNGIVAINHADTVAERKERLKDLDALWQVALLKHVQQHDKIEMLPKNIMRDLDHRLNRRAEYYQFFFFFVAKWTREGFNVKLPDP
jgi:hypothetical protein